MVNKSTLVFIFLLISIVLSATAPPTGSQIYCSAFCAPAGCTGYSPADCNNKCNTARGWNPVSGACDVTNPAFSYLDCSDDAGGMITVSPNVVTTKCPNLTGYLGLAPYGEYKANDVVTITLAGGTTIGHYALDFFFDLILIDIDGSKKWNNAKFTITLLSYNGTVGADLPLTMSIGGGGGSNYKVYCGDTGKN